MSLILTPIQILLTAILIGVALASLQAFRNRPLYRVMFLTVLLVGILFILIPDIPVLLAQWLNVGRGADLVFYLLFVGILFVLIIFYRRLLSYNEMMTRIIRQNAIRYAKKNTSRK